MNPQNHEFKLDWHAPIGSGCTAVINGIRCGYPSSAHIKSKQVIVFTMDEVMSMSSLVSTLNPEIFSLAATRSVIEKCKAIGEQPGEVLQFVVIQ